MARPVPFPILFVGLVLVCAGCAPADRDPQLRALARWEDRRLAPTDSLSALIAGPDAVVRRAALQTAGRIGRTDVLPAMIAALDDRSLAVREQAAFSLGLLGDDAATGPLIRALDDPHLGVRVAALEGLGHQEHDGAELIRFAVDGAEREAAAAWTALRNVAELADHDSLVAAIRAGLARSEPAVRWRVLRCAERAPDSTLVAQIAPYADDSDPQIRVHALRALGRHSGAAAAAAVLGSAERHGRLRGQDLRRVQVAELRALAGLAGPLLADAPEADPTGVPGRAAAVLGDGAQSRDPQVAEVALDAMSAAVAHLALPAEAARQESLLPVWRIRMVRVARERLDDPAPAVRGAAFGALGALRGPGARHELTAGLADADPDVAGAAAAALIALAPPDDELQAVLERARDRDRRTYVAALTALDRLWPDTAPLDTLPRSCRGSLAQVFATEALADPDFVVQATAARLLGRFPGGPACHALARTYQRATGPDEGMADVRLEVIGAWDHLFAALAAGAPVRAPRCLRRTWFDSVAAARAVGVPDALADVVPVEDAHRDEVAGLLQRAFDDPDLRIRLAARGCAEAHGLLPPPLIPTAASLRETLPAFVRDPAQPPVTRPFRAPDLHVVTDRGAFTIRLDPAAAPNTCAAVLALARAGFHEGLTFHRVVPDFVIQGGCPRDDGWGGPGWTLRSEWSRRPFVRGTVGIAHSGKDTGGSQFFVCHSAQPHLDGRYTVFGEVVDGMDVVDAIERGDRYRMEVITR
ncbi:MAG: peptidylprolyl isomerase [Candidatus Krumholzibacteriia bacterium]